MPELPEVETTKRGIKPHVVGQTITGFCFRHKRLRFPIPIKELQALTGDIIEDVNRRGKYLLLKVADGHIIIHLGMSGRIHILTKKAQIKKHDHVDIEINNDLVLRLNDPRRFGAALWCQGDINNHALIKHLGVEPLTAEFSAKYLLKHANHKSVTIKTLLMNNKIVVGIGNIYATESLHASNIHPAMPAKQLTLTQAQALTRAIKLILKNAIKKGGTTLKDFLNADGKPGYFNIELKAYGRDGLPCKTCHTLLQSIRQQQRISVFCPKCQVNNTI